MLTQIILQAQDNTKIMELNAKGQEYLFNHNYEKAIKSYYNLQIAISLLYNVEIENKKKLKKLT